VVYKKTDFNPKSKKLELAFLSKRFDKKELASLKNRLNINPYLKGTDLVIRQDSTDRFNALRGDILNQIKSSENEMNEKDVKIVQLEKELTKNTFDNKQLLKESRTLFPAITSLSVTRNSLVTPKDSVIALTAVIYDTSKSLSNDDQEKFRNWLNERLSVKNVELFKKQ